MILRIPRMLVMAFLFVLFNSFSCDKNNQLKPDITLIRIGNDKGVNELHFPKILALDSNAIYILNGNGELVGKEYISLKDSSKCYMAFTRMLGANTDWLYDYYLKQNSDSSFYLIKGGFASGELDCGDEVQLNSIFFEYEKYRLYSDNLFRLK